MELCFTGHRFIYGDRLAEIHRLRFQFQGRTHRIARPPIVLLVIIYIVFKHTAVELKTKSTSYPKEIAGFDNKKFRLEFHALFSATSAKDLATKRKVAFQQESGTVEHRGQALAYAGIENLHNYVESKDDALASHLRMLWHFLKKCEPLQTVGVDQKSDADEVAYMLRVTGEAPVQAEAASVQPSEFSITFNHADLIETLETGLNIMGKQAAHAQST